MPVIVAKDQKTYKTEVAKMFLESAVKAVKEKGQFSAALSGGSAPKESYSVFAEPYFKSRFPWEYMTFFWADERCVPPGHSDSNYKASMDAFLSKVPVPSKNIIRMPGEVDPPREAAKSYESALKAHFKLTIAVPHFDFIFLGIGEDGHTASLFPGTAALQEKDHWVTSNFVEKLSSNRITLTYPILNAAKKVVFLCSGADKTKILKEIFRDDISPDRYPAQKIKPENGECIWVLDSFAAANFPSRISKNFSYI